MGRAVGQSALSLCLQVAIPLQGPNTGLSMMYSVKIYVNMTFKNGFVSGSALAAHEYNRKDSKTHFTIPCFKQT